MKQCQIKKILLFSICTAFLILAYTQAAAETRFGQPTPEKKLPAEINFDEIWFDSDGTKVIPDISTRWLAVVFDPRFTNVDVYANESGGTYESLIQEKAKTLISSFSGLIDFLYDKNLAEDACFFRLREGMMATELKQLIVQLNQDEAVSYIHPAIILNNKTYAFFNALGVTWKAGADIARKDRLLQQAFVSFDQPANLYRVNVLEIPFFTALHLLGEDISVLKATPYLTEIKPAIQATLDLAMNGAHIGDTIPFIITIVFSDRITIDPSSLSTINLRPFNIQRELFDSTFVPYDPTKIVLQSPVKISGTIISYAPGEFVLPPVTVNYTCQECSGSPVRSFETKTVPFKVASLVPAAKEGNRLLVPADVINPEYHLETLQTKKAWFLTAALAALALFFICVVGVVTLAYQKQRESKKTIGRTNDEMLADEIRLALRSAPSTPHWQYLAHAGNLVRSYIAVRYQIPMEHLGGSGTGFVDCITSQIPDNCVELLRGILETIDNAVALELKTSPDIGKLQTDIATLLNVTGRQNNTKNNFHL